MNTYAFNGALYCEECGEKIKTALWGSGGEYRGDSGEYPQGPYPYGGGEADCPQHCDGCGSFLENPLTHDGDVYVRGQCSPYVYPDDDGDVAPWSLVAERAANDGKSSLAEWIRFYFAPGM